MYHRTLSRQYEGTTDHPSADDAQPDGRDETKSERLDRNFDELLQELRVAQTGVQILFAFLLTLPFTSRFPEVTEFQRDVYLATLLCSAAATALLIAPVSFHRIVFRMRLKGELVTVANRMAIGGLFLLLLSVVGGVLLITDVVLGAIPTLALTAAVTVWFVLFWSVVPLVSAAGTTARSVGCSSA